MKALMYNGIGQMDIENVPEPQGELIVKVLGCGICGTDLKTFLKGHHFFKPPTILGHEFYGTVAKAPEGHDFKVGDTVVVAPYYECGECDHCRRGVPQLCKHKKYVDGAFCEYVSVPVDYPKGIYRIPVERIGAENADVFTLVEPLACVLNGTEHLDVHENSRVLVVGGGPMGILFALFYQQQQVPVTVVEPNEDRRSKLQSWGIPCVRPEDADPSSYDNIVVAVNKADLVADYVKRVSDGGTVLVFSGLKKEDAIITDSYSIHYREVTMTGSCGFASAHFRKAYEMISAAPQHYRRLITHRFPLERGLEAFELLQKGGAFKVVLEP